MNSYILASDLPTATRKPLTEEPETSDSSPSADEAGNIFIFNRLI
jgi:hypothetical protein